MRFGCQKVRTTAGLNDRHLVASRADVVNCLNVIEDILLHPIQLYEEMKNDAHADWNNESFLARHFLRKGLLGKVKRFPYAMYLARPANEEGPTFSPGRYNQQLGITLNMKRNTVRLAPVRPSFAAARIGRTAFGMPAALPM